MIFILQRWRTTEFVCTGVHFKTFTERKSLIKVLMFYVLVDEVWVHFAHRRAHPKLPPTKNNRKHARTHTKAQHLFANCLVRKNTGFSSLGGHNQQGLLCRVLGSAVLVAVGGVRPRNYDDNDGSGGDWRRITS